MSRLPNFIKDLNPFSLAGPPGWFLEKLYEFDDSLVIVPSRQGFYYRLAQRRKPQLVDKMAYEVLKEQADTAMLMSYSLVPVTTIVATVNWGNPLIFQELHNRAPWRMGGADAANHLLDSQDRKRELDKAIENDERNTYLAKDGGKFYQQKIGLRSHLWSPTVKTQSKPNSTPLLIVPGEAKPSYKPIVTTVWSK